VEFRRLGDFEFLFFVTLQLIGPVILCVNVVSLLVFIIIVSIMK
jgi:hypothetical protein